MIGQSRVWVIAAFALYLVLMIIIGAKYINSKSSEDYFLGSRGLNKWVAAFSSQASDMSSWLLMGLPGAIYLSGIGQIWIAIGLFIGTVFNWVFISARLRRYTIRAGNALTLPEYFANRFHDKSKRILVISSVITVIFFLVYTASALSAGGKLFNIVFGIDYKIALFIGAFVILAYTFMGGFMAVCVTDFIQGMLMLVCLMAVPIISLFFIGGFGAVPELLNESSIPYGTDSFLNIFNSDGSEIGIIGIISQLGWGLGYCGMPHILTRFMAVKSECELKKSRVIAIIWVIISLSFACLIGVVGRVYLLPKVLGGAGSSSENVFIEMITKMFSQDISVPFIGGLFLCGILAAIMSTADSQLLVTSSSVSEDLYRGIINKNAGEKHVLFISRLTVLAVAVLAFFIALNPNNSIMGLVSIAWAGLGSAFGPVVLLSLFWKRSNINGAVAGMISGGATVLIWEYIPLINGQTLGKATGLYSLVIGFAIGIVSMVLFSLATKEPDNEILKEFSDVSENKNIE